MQTRQMKKRKEIKEGETSQEEKVEKRPVKKSKRRHEAELVPYHTVQYIEIDKKLVPLMKELWNAGIRTRMSCEDNVPKGYVWIEFRSPSDLDKFLATQGESLHKFLKELKPQHFSDDRFIKLTFGTWIFTLGHELRQLLGSTDAGSFCSQLEALVKCGVDVELFLKTARILHSNIRFPQTHLPQVLENVQKYETQKDKE